MIDFLGNYYAALQRKTNFWVMQFIFLMDYWSPVDVMYLLQMISLWCKILIWKWVALHPNSHASPKEWVKFWKLIIRMRARDTQIGAKNFFFENSLLVGIVYFIQECFQTRECILLLCRIRTMTYITHTTFMLTHLHNGLLLLKPALVALYK